MNMKTVTKSFSNIEIKEKILSLQPVLTLRNIVGYAAARNARVLTDALTEYSQFEYEAVIKYGTTDMDDNGRPLGTTSITPDSEQFDAFVKEMAPLQELKQEVSVMVVKFDEVIGQLSGEEILGIDWMLED